MQRKKIGIVSHDFHPYQGGLGRHVTSLLQNLNTIGMPYVFIGLSPNNTTLDNHCTELGFTKRLPVNQLQFSLFFQVALERIIKRNELCGLIINGGPGGVFCLRSPSVPLLYIANHTYAQQCQLVPGQGYKRLFKTLEKISYQHAQHIVAISSTTRTSLQLEYAIPETRLSVIPPGFMFDETAKNICDSEKKDFLFLGRLDSRKGIVFLLEAFAGIASRIPDSILHIAGTGNDRSALIQYARARIPHKQVVFHGFVSDAAIDQLRASCIAQIIPSRLEGFGLAAVESIQAGVPVIATDVPGLTDIITHDKTGLLVPFGNTSALGAACVHAVENPAAMEVLARNAYEYAVAQFSWDTILPQYRALFNRIFV